MTTYEFVASWVKRQLGSTEGRVLDYVCGAGRIVKLLRDARVDAWGCDVFHEGGDYSTQIPADSRPCRLLTQRLPGMKVTKPYGAGRRGPAVICYDDSQRKDMEGGRR